MKAPVRREAFSEGTMAAVTYKGYRIEIRPVPIPGGWSAQMHVWNFQAGTTHVVPLAVPTHLAFLNSADAHAYAEKLATQWVEQAPRVDRRAAQEASPPRLAADDRRKRSSRKRG
jgi:hypothetical protein